MPQRQRGSLDYTNGEPWDPREDWGSGVLEGSDPLSHQRRTLDMFVVQLLFEYCTQRRCRGWQTAVCQSLVLLEHERYSYDRPTLWTMKRKISSSLSSSAQVTKNLENWSNVAVLYYYYPHGSEPGSRLPPPECNPSSSSRTRHFSCDIIDVWLCKTSCE